MDSNYVNLLAQIKVFSIIFLHHIFSTLDGTHDIFLRVFYIGIKHFGVILSGVMAKEKES